MSSTIDFHGNMVLVKDNCVSTSGSGLTVTNGRFAGNYTRSKFKILGKVRQAWTAMKYIFG